MKDIRISVRVSQETKDRLEKAEKVTGIEEAVLIRNCVSALLDEIEEKGQITFPLEVGPKKKTPQKDSGDLKYQQREEIVHGEEKKPQRKLISTHPALDPNAPIPPADAPEPKPRRLPKGVRGIEKEEEN